jgi:hypothetical protein
LLCFLFFIDWLIFVIYFFDLCFVLVVFLFDGMGNWTTISNNARGTANCRGDIGIQTRGMVANSSYTLILELRKDNAFYQRGQFNDPAAFNYGTYGLKP